MITRFNLYSTNLNSFVDNKIFEKGKTNYKYLNDEQTIIVDGFVRDFIKENKIIEKIKKLKIDDFIDNDFNYLENWNDLLVKSNYNIYRSVYSKLTEYNLNPAISNTLSDIINKLYIEYKIKNKFDEIVIKLLDKSPKKYKKIFNEFEDELSDEVKTHFSYIYAAEKYNL
jgi:hypothetical protein